MKKIVLAFVAASLCWSVGKTQEVDLKGVVEFGPYGGYTFLDSYGGADPKNAYLGGARLGVFFTDWFSTEVGYQRVFSKIGGVDFNIDSARLNFLAHFLSYQRFRPFITVGGGWERNKVDGAGAENDLGANAGAGLRFIFAQNLSARIEARYATLKFDTFGWQKNIELLGGLSWLFGAGHSDVEAAPADSDGDGVADDRDRCPNTPMGVTVDASGCEVQAVAEVVEEADADGDNVPDSADACPNTPMGVQVDARGCPLDTDNDGVADYRDKCPGTQVGEKVDEFGCPERVKKARGALTGVTFLSGKSALTENSKTLLNSVADVLKEFPDFKVEVQGHTDATGNANLNMNLSVQRAEAVRQYLISRGVAEERLSARGYGQSMPVADNSTVEGRNRNRRVELKWLD